MTSVRALSDNFRDLSFMLAMTSHLALKHQKKIREDLAELSETTVQTKSASGKTVLRETG
jgi:hypothetical protein